MDYLKLTKEQIVEGIKNELIELNELPKYFKDDAEVMLEATKLLAYGYGNALRFASEKLKRNKKFILQVIKIDYSNSVLHYASKRLRDDKKIILEAIVKEGWLLCFASDRLKSDKKFILKAVKKNAVSLFYASEELQNDKDLLKELKLGYDSNWNNTIKISYDRKMEVLKNINDKEYLESNIIKNNIQSKKIKF